MKQSLKEECTEIVRKLIAKHAFLQPDTEAFDVWDKSDAVEVLADLINLIKYSDEIAEAHHNETEFGK